MATYTPKELYMMNGGNTLYIYKDGYGDIYHATVAEEAEWSKEIVTRALSRLDVESNATNLRFAINDLIFHRYDGVEALLHEKIQNTTPVRTIVLATMLWVMKAWEKSYEVAHQQFELHRETCIDDFFYALIEFRNHQSARKFLVDCLTGDDPQLKAKAQVTATMWAYTGLPELRTGTLLDDLKSADTSMFKMAVRELRFRLRC